jgi:hypothetical protein
LFPRGFQNKIPISSTLKHHARTASHFILYYSSRKMRLCWVLLLGVLIVNGNVRSSKTSKHDGDDGDNDDKEDNNGDESGDASGGSKTSKHDADDSDDDKEGNNGDESGDGSGGRYLVL